MHQKRNIAESIVSTCMDIMGKIKDNFKARRDIADVCNRLSLDLDERGGKSHAPFVLKVKDRKEVMRWMKRLKFSDGYAVGLKQCVNVTVGKIHWLKSHDYHIIMERLLSVMLHGYLDDEIWEALAKLSYFYRQLCAKEIKKDMMEKLKEISVLICKLEKIFPPGWFNLMQHLLVHIPYEAKVGGLVQYRWMYHIERALKYLRVMVNNKARVEGSITESFLLKNITYFTISMLLPCDTMSMKNLLSVTLKIFNGEAQLQAAARPIIILKKNERLLCSTCIAIWKRWICFSCKCLLYFLPPYSSTSRSYSFIFLYSEFDK
jgi:hypothetical protein